MIKIPKPKVNPQKLKYKLNANSNLKLSDLSKKRLKKELLKSISQIDDPAFCEAMIVQLEARKEQLNPDFMSYTPKR